ncbi:hypothetical protein PDESU_04710 [Pontiella desulfatans]|uniref:Ice-binding protein C-terminal domain-containing protein n=1 Tax=Pontiella desulfatans TaxID=2750659 RepID=A0A6C2U7U4_PONDE|nr:PEP-CTERM sorting domain-containing protein [Pontiella desulfatans]VGO16120.1 hypothetical protein PDESU_04710 [Pontiella desulfatans]
MKKAIVLLSAIALAGAASADIYTALAAGFGIGGNGSAGGIVNATDGTQILLQLIDGGGDGLDYEAGMQVWADGVKASGNDTVLGTLSGVVTSGGADYSDWAGLIAGTITATYTADAWIRVSGTEGGDWVYEQAMSFSDIDISDPKATPEGKFFDNGGAGGTATGAVTVIPEPATIGLMGIAGIGMFLARRKARR